MNLSPPTCQLVQAREASINPKHHQPEVLLMWALCPTHPIQERFIRLYSTVSTTAQALADIIQDGIIRMNLSMEDLRGQCYDGASNMSGRTNSAAPRVKSSREAECSRYTCTAQ